MKLLINCKSPSLALLSALLLILSFPKFDLWFLAWIALAPLFVTLKDKSLKSAFGLSFFMGISSMMGIFYWINIIEGVKWNDFILLGVYFGSYFGLFGLALGFVTRNTKLSPVFAAPFIWVSLEYLRSHAGFLGLPWALLGHSQYLNIPVIQVSSIAGVYGVSFLIVMVNALLSEIFLTWASKRRWALPQPSSALQRPVIATLLVVGTSLLYAMSVLSNAPGGDKFRIAVIQGNIPQELKWKPELRKQHLNKHARLTREAASSTRPTLIVWPEGSVQRPLKRDLHLRKMLYTLTKETNTYLLVGSAARPKIGSKEFRKTRWFNSAFFFSPERGIVGQYDKIRLLPFAEYLPYKDSPLWPSRLASKAGVFVPGKEYTTFNVNGAKFGVTICWENIFPNLFRRFVLNGANFMVNITNEAWFGETAVPYQFMAMSVFRAVENRVSVVRSANTGISGFIDPYGRVIGNIKSQNKDIFVEGFLTKDIPLSQQRTFYTIYGDIFVYMNLLATVLMLSLSYLKSQRGWGRARVDA